MTLPPNLTDRQRRYMEMYLGNGLSLTREELDKETVELRGIQSSMTDAEWNGIMDLLDPRRKSR